MNRSGIEPGTSHSLRQLFAVHSVLIKVPYTAEIKPDIVAGDCRLHKTGLMTRCLRCMYHIGLLAQSSTHDPLFAVHVPHWAATMCAHLRTVLMKHLLIFKNILRFHKPRSAGNRGWLVESSNRFSNFLRTHEQARAIDKRECEG